MNIFCWLGFHCSTVKLFWQAHSHIEQIETTETCCICGKIITHEIKLIDHDFTFIHRR